MKSRIVTLPKIGVALAAACLVTACASSGGGSGSGGTGGTGGGTGGAPGGTTGTPPPPPTAASFKTSEYLSTWALDAINAAEAYVLGYTGEGVTIGIVDFGFDFDGGEIDFHNASVDADEEILAWYHSVYGLEDEQQHGQQVAATAAALKNGAGMHGLAFDARVLAIDYHSIIYGDEFVDADGITWHVSNPWSYLIDQGVKIINKSYGYLGDGDPGDPGLRPVAFPESETDYYVNDYEVVAVGGGALVVAAAGNTGEDDPILSNRVTATQVVSMNLTQGPGAFVIVGSVRPSGSSYVISDFSNRAGEYADFFMVAPGEDITVPCGATLCSADGTSFAAPLVTGAAALILQRWPHLKGRQLADILFESATDLGIAGVDETYGHGMLNVEAALQPLGVTTLGVEGGMTAYVETSGIVLGGAFGDAPAFTGALSAVPIRDSFNRDFGIDLSPFVWRKPQSQLSGLIEQRTRWHSAAYAIGMNAGLAVRLYDKPELPFQLVNGLEEPDVYRGTIELRGSFTGFGGAWVWSAGNGLGLGTALADENPVDSLTPLTRAFSSMMESEIGQYVTARVSLNEDTQLSFGVSHARENELDGHYLTALEDGAAVNAAAMRFDHRSNNTDISFELGGAFENGAILGSYGSGALTLAERSMTAWTRFGGAYHLGGAWSLNGVATFAFSDATLRPGSLVAALDPILSTSASFGIERTGLFAANDALTFTVHQPLRAEAAPITLYAASLDLETGAPNVGTNLTSLTPSGRELGFELGYGAAFGAWRAQANLAYRHDARHVAGAEDMAALFWLSRSF